MISQQFKFVGRGRQERLKEFNARINYILRQMTRDADRVPMPKTQVLTKPPLGINPPEAQIVTSKQGMIDAAVITFYTDIPESEPRYKESQEAEKAAEEPTQQGADDLGKPLEEEAPKPAKKKK